MHYLLQQLPRIDFMPISFERAFSIHDDAMLLRGRRSSVLAANIANTDTPHYKARDFDFNAMLRGAQQNSANRLSMATSHSNHISPDSGTGSQGLQYRNPLHASLDGNTVDSHVEQAKFSENALMYQASFNFLNGKIQGLMQAIKGE